MNVSEIIETLQVKNQHKIIEKSLPVPKRSIFRNVLSWYVYI